MENKEKQFFEIVEQALSGNYVEAGRLLVEYEFTTLDFTAFFDKVLFKLPSPPLSLRDTVLIIQHAENLRTKKETVMRMLDELIVMFMCVVIKDTDKGMLCKDDRGGFFIRERVEYKKDIKDNPFNSEYSYAEKPINLNEAVEFYLNN